MARPNVIRRRNQSPGQGLYPVAMGDNQVGAGFGDEVGKADHGFRQHHILRIAGALVQKLMHTNALHPLHFQLGQAIARHHMHAGDKKADGKTRSPRGLGQRLQFPEISAGSGYEKQ